jgi:hypothetical protein
MPEPHSDPHLYIECLAAMAVAVAGDVYPCDTLAPVVQAECALPAGQTVLAPQDHHAPAMISRIERT